MLSHYFSSIIYFILSLLIFFSGGSLHSPPLSFFFFIIFLLIELSKLEILEARMVNPPDELDASRRWSGADVPVVVPSVSWKGFAPPRRNRGPGLSGWVHGVACVRAWPCAALSIYASPDSPTHSNRPQPTLTSRQLLPPMKYFFLEFIRKSFDLKLENQRIWSLL